MILAARRRRNPQARGLRYVAQASAPAGCGGVSPPEWRPGPILRHALRLAQNTALQRRDQAVHRVNPGFKIRF